MSKKILEMYQYFKDGPVKVPQLRDGVATWTTNYNGVINPNEALPSDFEYEVSKLPIGGIISTKPYILNESPKVFYIFVNDEYFTESVAEEWLNANNASDSLYEIVPSVRAALFLLAKLNTTEYSYYTKQIIVGPISKDDDRGLIPYTYFYNRESEVCMIAYDYKDADTFEPTVHLKIDRNNEYLRVLNMYVRLVGFNLNFSTLADNAGYIRLERCNVTSNASYSAHSNSGGHIYAISCKFYIGTSCNIYLNNSVYTFSRFHNCKFFNSNKVSDTIVSLNTCRIDLISCSFSGTSSAKQYLISNGVIYTGGAGINILPGNSSLNIKSGYSTIS